MNKFFFRKLKSRISKVNAGVKDAESNNAFHFKRSKALAKHKARRTTSGYSWNARTMFMSISLFTVILYSLTQLGIGVYLDEQSKKLQVLRDEEAYLVEENRDLESKIANQSNKFRVELTAQEDLQMRKLKDSDIVHVTDTDISASLTQQ